MRIVLILTVVESALIAGLLMWLRFRSQQTPAPLPSEMINSSIPLSQAHTVNSSRDARWRFINSWNVVPQFNDRVPALGAVRQSIETAPGRRSANRRTHQVSNKQWSRERHD